MRREEVPVHAGQGRDSPAWRHRGDGLARAGDPVFSQRGDHHQFQLAARQVGRHQVDRPRTPFRPREMVGNAVPDPLAAKGIGFEPGQDGAGK